MKISFQWLKDYIPVDLTAEELAYKLTMAGLEVENIEIVNGDPVLEIEVTPNRPDCLNMIGITREVSAILNREPSQVKNKEIAFPAEACDISIEDKQACSRYIGTVIKGTQISAAADFLRNRLVSVGIRPINNIVDITNFCLMETGQPLHAFDYDKLIGGKIIVRKAYKGEKIITIDGVERELDPSILIIADQKRPVAIAGIMGGKETEVTDETKNILLESAYFDPILIRRASRKLGLASDSSYRFERGVDYLGVEQGSLRALAMIVESAKGKITHHRDLSCQARPEAKEVISIRMEDINHFLGASVSQEECVQILQKLDFMVEAEQQQLAIRPPSFRADIKEGVDVFEEIARIRGYDNLPYRMPTIPTFNMPLCQKRQKREKVRQALVSQGFNEIITYTMISKDVLQKAGQKELHGTEILNPLSADQEILRPGLFPNMLMTAQYNINRGQKDLRLFETGKAYVSGEEKERLALLMTGVRRKDWRNLQENAVDYFDLKGIVEQLFKVMRLPKRSYQEQEKEYFEPGLSVSFFAGKETLGEMGSVSKDILAQWGIKQEGLFYAEIDLEKVYSLAQTKGKFQPLSEYPCIVWDISLAVNKEVSFQEIERIVTERGAEILIALELKEEYVGEKVSSDKRGITISLTYQSQEKTLTEEEVACVHERICQTLIDDLGAVKR